MQGFKKSAFRVLRFKIQIVMKTMIRLLTIAAAMSAAVISCAISSDDLNPSFFGEANYGSPDELGSGGDRFDKVAENPFVKTKDQNVSTFSVDADGASYAIMRKYVGMEWPVSSASVRVEEFLNYFTFDYPDPTGTDMVRINAETGPCPWNGEHRLLRLGLKGKSLADDELPTANFVFLVDVSGSMYSKDKLELLKTSLTMMLDYLRPEDRISIVTYSGSVRKVLESTPVNESGKIKGAIAELNASGSTAGGKALEMAYEEALANYIQGGNNRVILGTDGDFNVGVTDSDELASMVEEYAGKGIYLTVCGFGSGNLNDAMMKKLSVKGNGTYQYIDSEEEMAKVFVQERSKFVAVANDTKVQVTFDPEKIESYRLIGYERRVMDNEDFEDNTKDAGEIGAGQTITALYEIVPAEGYKDGAVCGKFDCRYKKSLLDSESQALSVELTASEGKMSPELSFASGVTAYGLVLLNSEYKGEASLDMASELVKAGLTFDPNGYRAELLELISKVKVEK